MSNDIDVQIIQNTQEVLSKYIKKPPLTEKLLRKPPFRFLHDVVTNIVRETGFLKGLYSERELVSENVKDKDDKIAFLNKLIDATKVITEMDLTVRSSKIIAGFEPLQTNLLLQAIGTALDKKLDSSQYINDLKSQKSTSKKNETVKDADKKVKVVKSKEKIKVAQENEKPVKTTKNVILKSASSTKLNSRRSASTDSKKIIGTNKKGEKQEKHLPTSVEKNEIQSTSEVNFQNDLKSNEDVLNVSQENNIADPKLKEIVNNTELIKPHLPSNEILTDDSLEKGKKSKNDEGESQFTLPMDISANIEKKDKTINITNNEGALASPRILERQNSQTPKISRPKSSLRPVSVRPSSARPGAPRLQKSDSNLLKDKEILPMGKVQVIDENFNNAYIDEEETVTIEAAVEVETPAPVLQLPTDKGHLVEQILQQINNSDMEPTKRNVNVEWEQAGLRNRNTAVKEVEQLKYAIQELTKMVNPLGKLINYLHEDIEAMQSELDMWNNSVRQIMIEVANQKKITDESNMPLQNKLDEIEENIIKHQQQIISTNSGIMRNEERIHDLLMK